MHKSSLVVSGSRLCNFNMTRSHRTKRNDGKPSRGRNGAALDGRSAMSKTVMIVEDNELNMKLFHDLLEAYGYHPIGTRNGIEALDLARKHRPHLILMGPSGSRRTPS